MHSPINESQSDHGFDLEAEVRRVKDVLDRTDDPYDWFNLLHAHVELLRSRYCNGDSSLPIWKVVAREDMFPLAVSRPVWNIYREVYGQLRIQLDKIYDDVSACPNILSSLPPVIRKSVVSLAAQFLHTVAPFYLSWHATELKRSAVLNTHMNDVQMVGRACAQALEVLLYVRDPLQRSSVAGEAADHYSAARDGSDLTNADDQLVVNEGNWDVIVGRSVSSAMENGQVLWRYTKANSVEDILEHHQQIVDAIGIQIWLCQTSPSAVREFDKFIKSDPPLVENLFCMLSLIKDAHVDTRFDATNGTDSGAIDSVPRLELPRLRTVRSEAEKLLCEIAQVSVRMRSVFIVRGLIEVLLDDSVSRSTRRTLSTIAAICEQPEGAVYLRANVPLMVKIAHMPPCEPWLALVRGFVVLDDETQEEQRAAKVSAVKRRLQDLLSHKTLALRTASPPVASGNLVDQLLGYAESLDRTSEQHACVADILLAMWTSLGAEFDAYAERVLQLSRVSSLYGDAVFWASLLSGTPVVSMMCLQPSFAIPPGSALHAIEACLHDPYNAGVEPFRGALTVLAAAVATGGPSQSEFRATLSSAAVCDEQLSRLDSLMGCLATLLKGEQSTDQPDGAQPSQDKSSRDQPNQDEQSEDQRSENGHRAEQLQAVLDTLLLWSSSLRAIPTLEETNSRRKAPVALWENCHFEKRVMLNHLDTVAAAAQYVVTHPTAPEALECALFVVGVVGRSMQLVEAADVYHTEEVFKVFAQSDLDVLMAAVPRLEAAIGATGVSACTTQLKNIYRLERTLICPKNAAPAFRCQLGALEDHFKALTNSASKLQPCTLLPLNKQSLFTFLLSSYTPHTLLKLLIRHRIPAFKTLAHALASNRISGNCTTDPQLLDLLTNLNKKVDTIAETLHKQSPLSPSAAANYTDPPNVVPPNVVPPNVVPHNVVPHALAADLTAADLNQRNLVVGPSDRPSNELGVLGVKGTGVKPTAQMTVWPGTPELSEMHEFSREDLVRIIGYLARELYHAQAQLSLLQQRTNGLPAVSPFAAGQPNTALPYADQTGPSVGRSSARQPFTTTNSPARSPDVATLPDPTPAQLTIPVVAKSAAGHPLTGSQAVPTKPGPAKAEQAKAEQAKAEQAKDDAVTGPVVTDGTTATPFVVSPLVVDPIVTVPGMDDPVATTPVVVDGKATTPMVGYPLAVDLSEAGQTSLGGTMAHPAAGEGAAPLVINPLAFNLTVAAQARLDDTMASRVVTDGAMTTPVVVNPLVVDPMVTLQRVDDLVAMGPVVVDGATTTAKVANPLVIDAIAVRQARADDIPAGREIVDGVVAGPVVADMTVGDPTMAAQIMTDPSPSLINITWLSQNRKAVDEYQVSAGQSVNALVHSEPEMSDYDVPGEDPSGPGGPKEGAGPEPAGIEQLASEESSIGGGFVADVEDPQFDTRLTTRRLERTAPIQLRTPMQPSMEASIDAPIEPSGEPSIEHSIQSSSVPPAWPVPALEQMPAMEQMPALEQMPAVGNQPASTGVWAQNTGAWSAASTDAQVLNQTEILPSVLVAPVPSELPEAVLNWASNGPPQEVLFHFTEDISPVGSDDPPSFLPVLPPAFPSALPPAMLEVPHVPVELKSPHMENNKGSTANNHSTPEDKGSTAEDKHSEDKRSVADDKCSMTENESGRPLDTTDLTLDHHGFGDRGTEPPAVDNLPLQLPAPEPVVTHQPIAGHQNDPEEPRQLQTGTPAYIASAEFPALTTAFEQFTIPHPMSFEPNPPVEPAQEPVHQANGLAQEPTTVPAPEVGLKVEDPFEDLVDMPVIPEFIMEPIDEPGTPEFAVDPVTEDLVDMPAMPDFILDPLPAMPEFILDPVAEPAMPELVLDPVAEPLKEALRESFSEEAEDDPFAELLDMPPLPEFQLDSIGPALLAPIQITSPPALANPGPVSDSLHLVALSGLDERFSEGLNRFAGIQTKVLEATETTNEGRGDRGDSGNDPLRFVPQ
ncbi:hypothetical protein GNI_026540 [Gregarina niphandrodes]|uniref:Uncharacterized protein n=1 Tax=Gregarina niphandrodes TaxID=110365 RepID=A0A023BBI2_GRENI|nr:hypothetical protein GNI_026540 [Gregarina niphandrodes]EZG79403.1 hypothetical protein GNI_026540 [Gregarina niphandrodes]|eukprot:XP_011129050.1 hypothetical protein GNI_026540 [Gregarina niphandrodes]